MFEQERMIDRLQRHTVDDPAIFACFLSGSFGRRASDAYSDLDVALIYPDQRTREHAWRNRVQFTRSIMPYISLKSFDGDHIRPYFHIALFANGSKVDIRFETKESSPPNPWDSQIRILKDTDGWAESFQAKSIQHPLPRASINAQELTKLDQRFWIMYWDVLRLLARGDADKSFPIYLELLHFTMPRLLDLLPLDVPIRAELIEAHFSQNTENTARHMKQLLIAYVGARQLIVERYHLQFSSDQSFENQIQLLVGKLT